MPQRLTLSDRVMGGIMGSAVGDALGAPCECLHYRHILKEYGDFKNFDDLAAVKAGWAWAPLGTITDDTVLADLLMDCILANDGVIDAHLFAKEWEAFETPIPNPAGDPVVRLTRMHYIEKIPYYRNKLREINKRELGHGEANATNAIMYIAPVGLLCAGDPNKAAVMAADVSAVNQHGRPRDAAAGYAASLAQCFVPGATVESVIETGVAYTRDCFHTREINAMLDLARKCKDCDEFIRRYYDEIIGTYIPFQDAESLGKRHWKFKDEPMCVSWNSAEILGPALATFLITRGQDAPAMMLACAKIGRDADTICRCAGGLIGTWLGVDCIPADWRELVVRQNRWLRLEEKGRALVEIIRRRAATLGAQLTQLGAS
jgi:ADP-ribosylglycohydrolase